MKITHTISQIFTGIAATATLCTGKVMAANMSIRDGINAVKTDEMPSELFGNSGIITNITHTILFVVGIISVIMLIYGGLRYVLSGGDSKKVADAKNTILYAIIGLIISLLAYAIVEFVLGTFGA